MRWHEFSDTGDDDVECGQVDCGVVVTRAALPMFAVGCPTPRCTGTGNAGYPCVFAPAAKGPVCTYCGTLGKKSLSGP